MPTERTLSTQDCARVPYVPLPRLTRLSVCAAGARGAGGTYLSPTVLVACRVLVKKNIRPSVPPSATQALLYPTSR